MTHQAAARLWSFLASSSPASPADAAGPAAGAGELRPPREFDVGFQDLVRRGEVHERAVLERFRAEGLDVVDVSGAQDGAAATAEGIRGGAGVVYQGTLAAGGPGAGSRSA